MSKKYKNKVCVYCAENLSVTGDHIFAREFFLKNQRANLPKAPSCKKCNNDKAKLEHYLTTILAFGGKHDDALDNLRKLVPKRLNKNIKLHNRISSEMKKVWVLQDSGLYLKQTSIRIEGKAILELMNYIVRGIYWLHCKKVLAKGTFIRALALTKHGEEYFDKHFFSVEEFEFYSASYGSGTITYKGVKDPLNTDLSSWVFSFYGGLKMYDYTGQKDDVSEKLGAITVPEHMINQK